MAARESEDGLLRPVVKWAGGKRAIVESLVQWMPKTIDTYAEPFCGGAAVFFNLAARKPRPFRRAILADKNAELVKCYLAIRDDIDELVSVLSAYQEAHLSMDEEERKEHFYDVRDLATEDLSSVERGARLIFLNKTCFNGLWRVNSKGEFNVPFGRYDKPKILNEKRLRLAHKALADVEILEADFQDVTASLGKRDFAYFDPPYVPVSKTANFTAYAKDGFGPAEQERLLSELARLRKKGVPAMLSNTCSPETEELYAGYPTQRVTVPRAINSDPTKRGEVFELVVMTYGPEKAERAESPRSRRKVAS